ncbi:hypothetical protein BCR34DRAFT_374858 [Clohesyomyces aquaticus]|uniref:Uncharacterized protein n=1 Tax=Clohesyomyces aquaticus TaxID=1231657 RepID=A0A1Y1ZH41_9PLEO|nr:hypothetical protein BCR34DRAFT_374858 [Clohesyomyces aquaticus]
MSNWQYSTHGDYVYAYGDQTAYIRHTDSQEWTAIYSPTSNATIRQGFGGIERASEGPFTWRRKGGSPWTLQETNFDEDASQETTLPPENPSLSLVLQKQAEGEPDHWSIFVAREGQVGEVYQVKGDAESMRYLYGPNIDLVNSLSYKNSYILVQDLSATAQAWVKHYAESETPPSAPNRAAVTENCQGWTYRVLYKLYEKDIISQEKIAMIHGMIEPVR